MPSIYFIQIRYFILFVFGCMLSLSSQASTESEITARLNSSLDILIRELPTIKTKERAADFIRVHVLPISDMSIMSRLMLGKHWRNANELQKKRFTAAMTKQLINMYAVFLIDTDANVKFEIKRISKQEGKRATKYTVHSKVTTTAPVDVMFKIYKRPGRDWKIVDVSIEGISLVLNWRNTLNNLIKTPADLNAVITKLENKTLEAK